MRKNLAVLMLLVLTLGGLAAGAQVTSNTATVALSMSVGESITVTPSLSTLPAFTYTSGSATSGSQSFTSTVAWQLAAGHTVFSEDFWLSSATAALTNGTTSIPASDVFLKINGGAYDVCNKPANGTPHVGEVTGAVCNQGVALSVAAPFTGTQTDTITLQLQGLPSTLSAGTYNGTLNIQAAAN